MNKNTSKSVPANILKKIKSGQVKMLPRWHFVLKSFLLLFGILISALFALYCLSFIVFILDTEIGSLPIRGGRGAGIFFHLLPWLLLLLSGIFIFIIQKLVKKYGFSYKNPIIYTIIGVIILAFSGSVFISYTGFHKKLSQISQEQNIPVFNSLYEHYKFIQKEKLQSGSIKYMSTTHFKISTTDSQALLDVIITPETIFPFGRDFKKDDSILVFGDREDNSIEAIGIRKDFSKTFFKEK